MSCTQFTVLAHAMGVASAHVMGVVDHSNQSLGVARFCSKLTCLSFSLVQTVLTFFFFGALISMASITATTILS